ncbi:hypothetical protein P152DRAFT_282522 [Eremomyces bilateralis CBS 781.70]|uniref:MYND-type domain-containing protein n=1 Tax=Eremomyces bilateralis CBS 781.70 TaxID=1392243 RepID=A0A6G1G9R3_9PEZI|nr:uncharacterized protein P152DRAFT_282522 [Eremomyces bilateralis CBS 781.70]KAF1814641.1 hypothetical protein P152DRAFT_282522 [Eremomyces bilateralis CBS 781.70]
MLLKPGRFDRGSVFYPWSTSPPACFTRGTPYDDDADILILEHGDIRDFLFTAYTGPGSKTRKLDFTCCEARICAVARSIVLLTMIIDDDGSNQETIWRLHSDMLIDHSTLCFLHKHMKKLLPQIATLGVWDSGKYGRTLRFSDARTWAKVKDFFEFYAVTPKKAAAFQYQQKHLKDLWDRYRRVHDAAPSSQHELMAQAKNAAKPAMKPGWAHHCLAFGRYRETGTCYDCPKIAARANRVNPLLATLDRAELCYASEPFSGSHLAPAFTKVVFPRDRLPNPPEAIDGYARHAYGQFELYCYSFRDVAATGRWKIRYVVADPIALCHVLQHHRVHGETETANWYGTSQSFEPLLLDSLDYTAENRATKAPTIFDIIACGDMGDIAGILNVLTACSPLLKLRLTSTIFTRTYFWNTQSLKIGSQGPLCADIATVALLLGLTPMEYWYTGTSTSSHDSIQLAFMDMSHGHPPHNITWKSTMLPEWRAKKGEGLYSLYSKAHLSFDARELASFMWRLYTSMFASDNYEALKRTAYDWVQCRLMPSYTRGGFAALLKLVLANVEVDYDEFVDTFGDMMAESREDPWLGPYLEALPMYLTSAGLFGWEDFLLTEGYEDFLSESCLRGWENLPTQLCVTFYIPPKHMMDFTKPPWDDDIGRPVVQVNFQTPDLWFAMYDVHWSWGEISSQGRERTNKHRLFFKEDKKGCAGQSPMVVTVMVPTWILLRTKDLSGEVELALRHDYNVAKRFGERLSMQGCLPLYTTMLSSKNVFITQAPPNLVGNASLSAIPGQEFQDSPLTQESRVHDANILIHAHFNKTQSRVSRMTLRVTCNTEELKQHLLEPADALKAACIEPFTVQVLIGLFLFSITPPMPLKPFAGVTRVKRKAGYIEYTGPVMSRKSLDRSVANVWAIAMYPSSPTTGNLHHIELDRMPTIDIDDACRRGWIFDYIGCVLNNKDKEAVTAPVPYDYNFPVPYSPFKLRIAQMILGYGCPIKSRKTVFMIAERENESSEDVKPHFIILLSSIKLDQIVQGVVLDCAVIPLSDGLRALLAPFMQTLVSSKGAYQVFHGTRKEIALWRRALMSFADRARTWPHKATCRYQSCTPRYHGKDGPICACGTGIFPSDYPVEAEFEKFIHDPKFNDFAVRVAIPVCFPNPLFEKTWKCYHLSNQAQVTETAQMMTQTFDIMIRGDLCLACREKPGGRPLLRCSGCHVAQYCSKECQSKDWKKVHKRICKEFAEDPPFQRAVTRTRRRSSPTNTSVPDHVRVAKWGE